jgi:hypothetical protein
MRVFGISVPARNIACHFQTGQQFDIARETADVAAAMQFLLSMPTNCVHSLSSCRGAAFSLSEQRSNSVADPPSNRHSFTMSNFGTVPEMATGEKRCQDYNWQMKQHVGLLMV